MAKLGVSRSLKIMGIVVPSLTKGGGVPSVARFVLETCVKTKEYEPRLFSLCMSSRDETSLCLSRPTTWLKGATTREGFWEGTPYTHIGANYCEIEFQRYQARKVLSEALSGCDLLQVVSGCPAWAMPLIGIGKPVSLQVATRVSLEREMMLRQSHGIFKIWRQWMTSIVSKYDDQALRSVDAIQVENSSMYAYSKSLNIDRHIDLQYAPPGIDTEIFSPLSERGSIETPYILCVGRLSDPRKDILTLLKAYSALPEYLSSSVRLVLAGSSGPLPHFWDMAHKLGIRDRITYIASPTRDELVELYRNASVFCLTSNEEGLGVVLLEAMSCGVPAISTRSGGPEDIITEGEDGFLVPLGDSKAISRKLEALLTNFKLNVRIGAAARKKIIKTYEKSVAGDRFVSAWDRLTSRL